MELTGIIIVGIIVIVVVILFVLKSKGFFKLLQTRSESKKSKFSNDKSFMNYKAEKLTEKQSESTSVIRELKTLDTKRYKANLMVERILADRIEKLKDELTMAREGLSSARTQLGDLEREYAVLKYEYRSERVIEWIRNLAGVGIGIFGTLFFSKDPAQSEVGKLVTPLFLVVFIITCIFSFFRKEKD